MDLARALVGDVWLGIKNMPDFFCTLAHVHVCWFIGPLSNSVPNAPRPVMGNRFPPLCFHLLRQII